MEKEKELLNRKKWINANIRRAFIENYTYSDYYFIFDFELENWQTEKTNWINEHFLDIKPDFFILKLIQETNKPKGWYLHDENLVPLVGKFPYLLKWYRSKELIGLIFKPKSQIPKFDHQVRKWNSKWEKLFSKRHTIAQ